MLPVLAARAYPVEYNWRGFVANFYGTDANDNVSGGFTDYYGGGGNDFLQGDAVANLLYGGAGSDVLNGISPHSLAAGFLLRHLSLLSPVCCPEMTTWRGAAATMSFMAPTVTTRSTGVTETIPA